MSRSAALLLLFTVVSWQPAEAFQQRAERSKPVLAPSSCDSDFDLALLLAAGGSAPLWGTLLFGKGDEGDLAPLMWGLIGGIAGFWAGLAIDSLDCHETEPADPRSPSPGPRYGHDMVLDEARGLVVLFGGFGPDGEPRGETWGWDGASWRLLSEEGPPPRRWPAMAYDSRREVVVLFGGRDGVGQAGRSLADTWIWNGARWDASDADGPPGRDHHRMAYDRRRDRVVLFGGWDGDEVVGDTWEWDGAVWHRMDVEGPSPRAPFGLAYHEADGEIVLMGGQDLDRAFGDTWTWDGTAWTRLDVQGPGLRGFHAMTYDPAGRRILLYGGRDGDRLLDDLWSWDGDSWTRLPGAGPLRRGIYASAYDPARGAFLFHGSGDLVDERWELEASTWAWTDEHGWERVAH